MQRELTDKWCEARGWWRASIEAGTYNSMEATMNHALVHPHCQNKMPETTQLINNNNFSHGSSSWEIKDLGTQQVQPLMMLQCEYETSPEGSCIWSRSPVWTTALRGCESFRKWGLAGGGSVLQKGMEGTFMMWSRRPSPPTPWSITCNQQWPYISTTMEPPATMPSCLRGTVFPQTMSQNNPFSCKLFLAGVCSQWWIK